MVELELLRVRQGGAAVLPLAPPAHPGTTTWNEDVAPFEVRDLDGDGREECVLVLEWQTTIPSTLIALLPHDAWGRVPAEYVETLVAAAPAFAPRS